MDTIPTFSDAFKLGNPGMVIIPISSGSDFGRSVTLQPDGKIVLAGNSEANDSYDFSLIRLNPDGSLDTSFSDDGKAIIPVSSRLDICYSVAVQSDGKIVLAGYSDYGTGSIDFSLVRLNADGSLDTSFSDDGKAIIPVSNGSDIGYSVTVQPDGKIVLAGFSYDGRPHFSLIRLNADGSLDSSFSDDGKAIIPVGIDDFGHSVTLQSDGKIVLAGFSYDGSGWCFSLIRLNTDGSLDSSFSDDGKVIIPGRVFDQSCSVAFQPDGKILLAGSGYSLIRLNADGSLDTSFGDDGKAIIPVSIGQDVSSSMTIQPDGKIVLAGYSSINSDFTDVDFSLVRLNADGSLDTSFNGTGKAIIHVGDSYDIGSSVVIQPDGQIVLAGYSDNGSPSYYDFSLIRLNADGSLDSSFNPRPQIGTPGDDNFSGSVGADTMLGGAGNDTYTVNNTGDVVSEVGGSGSDTVLASVTYSLNTATAAGVENLTLTGLGAINATGNALANILTGNAGDNVLDGGAGADTMLGGAGNDTYMVDNTGDVVSEGGGSGTDTVLASVTYSLSTAMAAGVEKLTLTGSGAINAKGNALANVLTGNAGDNVLDGGAGADTMLGGAGNDTYMVDNTGDVVSEVGGSGSDTVLASVTYSLNTTMAAGVEKLTLTGSGAINAKGNALANVLTGNAGDNVLDGGAGADTMLGGAGNDTYMVDNTGDVVSEVGGSGSDTVLASVTYSLNTATATGVENLTLTGSGRVNATGNALANVLMGNAGNNVLDGGAGADSLSGGAGNDTYVVDDVLDVVSEVGGSGTDTVLASVTYSLNSATAAGVENLTLTGSGRINAKGNALANVLTGNAGNNVLDGGAGADSLSGGAGSDTFVFSAGDSGQASGFDQINDYAKGLVGTGDLIDFSAALTIGGSAGTATSLQASINQNTGIASFAALSGKTLSDALADVAARFTAAEDSLGEFAFFKVRGVGDYFLFISDGLAGVGSTDVVIQLTGISSIAGIDLAGGNLTLIA